MSNDRVLTLHTLNTLYGKAAARAGNPDQVDPGRQLVTQLSNHALTKLHQGLSDEINQRSKTGGRFFVDGAELGFLPNQLLARANDTASEINEAVVDWSKSLQHAAFNSLLSTFNAAIEGGYENLAKACVLRAGYIYSNGGKSGQEVFLRLIPGACLKFEDISFMDILFRTIMRNSFTGIESRDSSDKMQAHILDLASLYRELMEIAIRDDKAVLLEKIFDAVVPMPPELTESSSEFSQTDKNAFEANALDWGSCYKLATQLKKTKCLEFLEQCRERFSD